MVQLLERQRGQSRLAIKVNADNLDVAREHSVQRRGFSYTDAASAAFAPPGRSIPHETPAKSGWGPPAAIVVHLTSWKLELHIPDCDRDLSYGFTLLSSVIAFFKLCAQRSIKQFKLNITGARDSRGSESTALSRPQFTRNVKSLLFH